MHSPQRHLIIYIGTSLDGYIAKPGDDLGFLSIADQEGEDYGYNAFINTVDTVILGRKTYDWVMKQVPEFPHSNKKAYIITRTPRPAIGNTEFYTGDLKELVLQLKAEPGQHIYCDGGAEVITELLKHNLVDELIISIVPILVGDGIRLFKDGRPELPLQLVSVRSFEKGLVQLYYRKQGLS